MTRLFGVLTLSLVLIGIPRTTSAEIITFFATNNLGNFAMDGPTEPSPSPGIGFGQVDFDTVAHTLRVRETFSGLLAGTTANHIHSATAVPGTGTAGVATQLPSFIGFPLGVTSGAFDGTFDTTLLSTYNPAFVTANGGTAASAEAALLLGMLQGRAYLNIHTTQFPGGEIRGFLRQVPEPSSLVLMGTAAVGLMAYGRRRLKK